MEWLISIASGVVGGNVSGLVDKAKSLGPVLNSGLGGLGGVLGQLLAGKVDFLNELGKGGNAAAGGVLGFLLPLLARFFKKGGTQ
jgi:hypothetical protein